MAKGTLLVALRRPERLARLPAGEPTSGSSCPNRGRQRRRKACAATSRSSTSPTEQRRRRAWRRGLRDTRASSATLAELEVRRRGRGRGAEGRRSRCPRTPSAAVRRSSPAGSASPSSARCCATSPTTGERPTDVTLVYSNRDRESSGLRELGRGSAALADVTARGGGDAPIRGVRARPWHRRTTRSRAARVVGALRDQAAISRATLRTGPPGMVEASRTARAAGCTRHCTLTSSPLQPLRPTRRALKAAWRPGHQTPKAPEPGSGAGEEAMATDRTAEDPARRADRRARRRVGRADPARRCAARRTTAASASATTRATSPGDPDLLNLTRPEVVARHPPRLPRRRRRHHDDEHLHGDLDRPGRLRARGRRLRDERRGRAARARRRATRRAAGFVAGSVGPLNVTLSLSPRVDDPAYRTTTFDAVVESLRRADARRSSRAASTCC